MISLSLSPTAHAYRALYSQPRRSISLAASLSSSLSVSPSCAHACVGIDVRQRLCYELVQREIR